jgi:MSHA biogenesis protein MshP
MIFQQRRQRGFTLLAGLFILIVLAALGAFMVRVSSMQHLSSAQDIQGSRAYQAARAGIEWGMYQALRNSSCVASASLTALGGLTDFGVTVTCAQSSYTEGANTVNVYDITATAATGTLGSAGYVERQLRATVSP